jgi:hypothetical protein
MANGYNYLLEGSFLRPSSTEPTVSVREDGRVLVQVDARHLSLTTDAAWALLSSLSAALQAASLNGEGGR